MFVVAFVSLGNFPFWQLAIAYLFLASFVIWMGTHSLTGLDKGRKWIAITARLLLLLVLLLLLGGLQLTRVNPDLDVMVVRDVSRSTQNVKASDLPGQITQYLRDRTKDKRPDDFVGQVSFDGAAQVDAPPSRSSDIGRASVHDPVDGTNVAQAIELGLAALPGNAMGRMVLFWDGNATEGDLDAAIDSAVARGVPIDVMPLRYSVEHEIMAERLDVPASRSEGDPVNLDLIAYSHNPKAVSARLEITDQGRGIPGFTGARQIILQAGANSEHISLGRLPAGAHYFRATLDGEPGSDTIADNNSADGVTLVKGDSRVLYIDDSPTAGAFAQTLQSAGLKIEQKTIGEFPHDLLGLQPYQAVILSNVSHGMGGLDDIQDRILTRYVQDLGGGMLMIGGPNSFGAGGWIGSQVEKILPVNCQPPAHRVMPAGALVLVIDHSGSMSETIHNASGSKEVYADQAAILALKTLMAKDYVGVVAFDVTPTWVVPLSQNDHPEQTSQEIEQITPRGGTNIYPPLVTAFDSLMSLDSSQVPVRHIVLLTDGDNGDFPADWVGITAKMRAANITLSTVGIGDDADKGLLTSLAQMGKGKFYFIEDPKILPQVFVKEAMTLRSTLIKEKPFVPRLRDADSPVLAGLPSVPQLTGLVSTWPKANPTIVQPLISEDADPLLSYWRIGLGQCAVFTSDTGERWANAWTGWPGYAKFFSQIVRTIERGGATTLASARIIPTIAGHAKLLVRAIGPQQQFADFVSVWVSLLSPDPRTPAQRIPLNQTGPGTYTADIMTPATGAYLASVHMDSGTAGSSWLDTAYVSPASPEMRDLQSNEFTLTEVTQRTGGRLLEPFDTKADLFDRDSLIEPSISRPLTNYLLALAIILLLVDVTVRRITIDRRMLVQARDYILGRAGPARQIRTSGSPTLLQATKKARQAMTLEPMPAANLPIAPIFDQPPSSASVADSPATSTDDNPLDRLAAAKRRARQGFKNNS
jgi:Ca-activated chloride channel homolog